MVHAYIGERLALNFGQSDARLTHPSSRPLQPGLGHVEDRPARRDIFLRPSSLNVNFDSSKP